MRSLPEDRLLTETDAPFTSATESNNLALLGLGRRGAGGERRRILVSSIEHKCVLAASRALRAQCRYEVELLPVDRVGRIDIAALEEALSGDVLLVSVMAVNNQIGTIQDIRHSDFKWKGRPEKG